jgi:6-pyruvoyltetrahydropterin/6-carboxytetrahydropterin synthase
MEVTVAKKEGSLEDEGSKAGMVIDFKDLKEIVKEEIISPLDHSFMYWTHSSDEIEHQLAQILQQADRKVFAVDFRPTAEMMAIYFFQSLEDKFNEIDIDLVSIKVWETPTSYAEFRGER